MENPPNPVTFNMENPSDPVTFNTRGYQEEMLEESLRRNIVVAMDTGSGKTRIAILRMKRETEVESIKRSWFLTPTVALCEQQHRAITKAIPVPVGLISGSLKPDKWTNSHLWREVLKTHRIIVSTPQVLLDALRHGYVNLGADISCLIFDEAHHTVDKDPYNLIMQEFYFSLPPRGTPDVSNYRPTILGLTASPIFGGNVDKAFRTIELNLDSTICTPLKYREELELYVHKPTFKQVVYEPPNYSDPPFSHNLHALQSVLKTLNIDDDPTIKSLRRRLQNAQDLPYRTDEWNKVDQELSKAISKKSTFVHKGLRHLESTAWEIRDDVGPWAADWYVQTFIEHTRRTVDENGTFTSGWKSADITYLFGIFDQVHLTPVSRDPEAILAGISEKTKELVACLLEEKNQAEQQLENNEAELNDGDYKALVFVTRRDTVLALTEILAHHPDTKDKFRVGSLIGASDSSHRRTLTDVTRKILRQSHADALEDFRQGEKNVLVCTSVAEEGLDISSCGCVIRWDAPKNMVSWMQSRGRARRKQSTFIILSQPFEVQSLVSQWTQLEKTMVERYNIPRDMATGIDPTGSLEPMDANLVLRSPDTGATITIDAVIPHLIHFCGLMQKAPHTNKTPFFLIDPPDFHEGWHSLERRLQFQQIYAGPWGATVVLPRALDAHLRVFSVPREYPTKRAAIHHAAFKAYSALHEAGLLNAHLLPMFHDIDTGLDEEVTALLKDIEKRSSVVNVSLQMNPWAPKENDSCWYATELVIDGLPPLQMFTRSRLGISEKDSLTLQPPNSDPLTVRTRDLGVTNLSDDRIASAREQTRRLLWVLYGAVMKWANLDFAYLFSWAPLDDTLHWEALRQWSKGLNVQSEHPKPEDVLCANALTYGTTFSWPDDLTTVRSLYRTFRFVRWRHEPLSPEEEEELRDQFKKQKLTDITIEYPLLEVQPIRHRNLLDPIPNPSNSKSNRGKNRLLPPNLTSVYLVSPREVAYATLLPSILRSVSILATTNSLHNTLFAHSSLSAIPLPLVTTAIKAPVSQGRENYQRLETLGDTVLKLITSVQFFGEYPTWHEGYLTRGKDHAVSNGQLAKAAIDRGLYQWIIRDRLVVRKWKPLYLRNSPPSSPVGRSGRPRIAKDDEKANGRKRQELSTKVLADVVESLIGAAYLHGEFDLAVDCAQLFGLGISWEKMPARVDAILWRVADGVDIQGNIPDSVASAESMLGYIFDRKLLLVEALTHASYEADLETRSYERMEFLGDSVLDMVVMDMLYRSPKNYNPGHLHTLKITVVNANFLAFICLRCFLELEASMPNVSHTGAVNLKQEIHRIYLWQCLLHSSTFILDAQRFTMWRYGKIGSVIEDELQKGSVFPWAALTRLQAPKYFSDIIEAVIGAVYLDSRGNLDVVRQVLRKLGILSVLERIIDEDVDVLHPISRMSIWAAKHQKKIQYKLTKANGKMHCAFLLGKEKREIAEFEDIYRGKQTENEVKFQVAEDAYKILTSGSL